jgi:hypothetical protein
MTMHAQPLIPGVGPSPKARRSCRIDPADH